MDPSLKMASEGDPLIASSAFNYFGQNQSHKIQLDELLKMLGSSLDGITTEAARDKRSVHGLNYIKPPISLPSILCCLLPCLTQSESMQRYHQCIPDSAMVKRNGKWIKIDSISLVPGDVVRVAKGDRVPADIRVFKVYYSMYIHTVYMLIGIS